MYYHAENECRGNYVVVDSQGENVKIFEIPHVQEEEEEEDDSKLEEVEIDFSKILKRKKMQRINQLEKRVCYLVSN